MLLIKRYWKIMDGAVRDPLRLWGLDQLRAGTSVSGRLVTRLP